MVILGDMMELGDLSMEEHRNIIGLIEELAFDEVIYIGEHFCMACAGKTATCFREMNDFISWLPSHPVSNRTILLKGSRKMRLETLLNLL
jgi:UDP-N-acetylmuramoyl-tripeptide--D-alanyl-D-alanine ligase